MAIIAVPILSHLNFIHAIKSYGMKTKLLLIAVLFASLLNVKAQHANSTRNSNETIFNGHVIHIYKTVEKRYGYDIFYQGRLLIHQNNNPFTGSAGGLRNRPDAITAAKWQIIHLQLPGLQPITDKRTLPMQVAREFKIDTN